MSGEGPGLFSLQVACLLMGGAVSKPSWLFGFRYPVSAPSPGASFVWGRFLGTNGPIYQLPGLLVLLNVPQYDCCLCLYSPAPSPSHVR